MKTIIALNVIAHGDERLPERFWEKTRIGASGCWEWTAQIAHHGYARYRVGHRSGRAHRVAYEALVGPIPMGLVLDHLCRVRHCVNPAHLEPVTNRENLLRGAGASLKTHCPKGHELKGENVAIHPRGNRYCRECHRARNRAWYARSRAAKLGGAS
ncbi:HNH endonuclease signature motif containing protein [Streptomyces sp. NPDC090109]|uniref:HNH endonuclease signature motif containing protein n=1 Tax=Streptomyces sp. NPDC090109 TaxID=3365948 RepID=UPI003804B7C7